MMFGNTIVNIGLSIAGMLAAFTARVHLQLPLGHGN